MRMLSRITRLMAIVALLAPATLAADWEPIACEVAPEDLEGHISAITAESMLAEAKKAPGRVTFKLDEQGQKLYAMNLIVYYSADAREHLEEIGEIVLGPPYNTSLDVRPSAFARETLNVANGYFKRAGITFVQSETVFTGYQSSGDLQSDMHWLRANKKSDNAFHVFVVGRNSPNGVGLGGIGLGGSLIPNSPENRIAVISVESLQPTNPTPYEKYGSILAHELGHCFGVMHQDGGLYRSGFVVMKDGKPYVGSIMSSGAVPSPYAKDASVVSAGACSSLKAEIHPMPAFSDPDALVRLHEVYKDSNCYFMGDPETGDAQRWFTEVAEAYAKSMPAEVVCTTGTEPSLGGRFEHYVCWRDPKTGNTGHGIVAEKNEAENGNSVSLAFGFFPHPVTGELSNWEIFLKILNGCAINGHWWAISAGLTNLETTITVVDAKTGVSKTYFREAGPPAPAILDITALPCD